MKFDIIFSRPIEFRGTVLDHYLSRGYYRMGGIMFTTSATSLDYSSENIPVFWLRTLLQKAQWSKTAKKIILLNQRFTIEVVPAKITHEIEALYRQYRRHIDFNASPSVQQYLFDGGTHFDNNPFKTHMVLVRDQQELIAVGYFDEGEHTIAGLMNFYHPQYARYSLGKYVMLQKMIWAKAHQKTFYYTGYLSPAITKFDYKLFPDVTAVEVLIQQSGVWLPYEFVGKDGLATIARLSKAASFGNNEHADNG
jgi:arginine-tRNA-protein transferase